MASQEAKAESSPPATSDPAAARERSKPSAFRSWLRGVGLLHSASQAESRKLLRLSRELCGLARQVSVSTRSPEDGAALLRKGIYQLFLAVLRLDGTEVTTYQECRDQIEASGEYRKIFADVIDDVPFLDELLQSFELVIDHRQGRRDRYAQLLERMPTVHRKVLKHLDGRLRKGGKSPKARRLVVAALVCGGAGLLFAVAYSQTVSSAQWGVGAPRKPAAPPSLSTKPPVAVDDPSKCFKATYFSDRSFGTLAQTGRDCSIAFDWKAGVPTGIPASSADDFSVRWEGVLEPPATDVYTFYLASDDGSRMYLNDQLVVDNWGLHPLAEVAGQPTELKQGEEYPLRIEYFEAGELARVSLSWSSSSFEKRPLSGEHVLMREVAHKSRPTVPPEPAEVLSDPTKCFTAHYFTGADFDTLVHTRRDCRIDFDWGSDGVRDIEDLPVDAFSIRWEGTLRVPATADYVFHLGSDDGSRLFIDDEAIVDAWHPKSFSFRNSEGIRLEEDVDHRIRVEFFDRGEVAKVRLEWSSEQLERTPLSGRFITPASPSAAPPGPE